MGLHETVLDETESWPARLKAYHNLARKSKADAHLIVNALLNGGYTSQLLGAMNATRDGNQATVPILHRLLDNPIDEDDLISLNIPAKALQAAVQLDPENSEVLLNRMLSQSPKCDEWITLIIRAASLAPRAQATSFSRSLLNNELFRSWKLELLIVLAQFDDEDAMSELEALVNWDDCDTPYLRAVVLLARAGHPKARGSLLKLLEQFDSLEEQVRRTLYLHASNVYGLHLPPSEMAQELLDVLTQQ